MVGVIDSCKRLFNCSSLYEVLKIEKDACESAIKKAYYKLALKVHPDRVGEQEKENATEKFQTLGKVYSILSDKEQRKLYDEAGVVGDDDFFENFKTYDWGVFFHKITKEDIIAFESKYKGSEEERKDIKRFYEEHKGDMDMMMEYLMCSSVEEEPRIRKIIEELIENKEVNKHKAFTDEPQKKRDRRKRRAAKEAAEAEKLAQELGLFGNKEEDPPSAVILQRQKAREQAAEDYFSALEAKYCGKRAKKGSAAKKKLEKNEGECDKKPRTSRKVKASRKK